MSRLRVTFGRGEPVKYLAHLDLVRLWERAIRRAELPLAYSAGFTPRPKLAFAAPLPVGVTSAAELLDITLTEALAPAAFAERIRPQLPGGITLGAISPIADRGRALPALLTAVEYLVNLAADPSADLVQERIAVLLAAETWPFCRERADRTRSFDLRPLVLDLAYLGPAENGHQLSMRLAAGPGIGLRPEEVTAVLGFPDRPRRIHRTTVCLQSEVAEAGADDD